MKVWFLLSRNRLLGSVGTEKEAEQCTYIITGVAKVVTHLKGSLLCSYCFAIIEIYPTENASKICVFEMQNKVGGDVRWKLSTILVTPLCFSSKVSKRNSLVKLSLNFFFFIIECAVLTHPVNHPTNQTQGSIRIHICLWTKKGLIVG